MMRKKGREGGERERNVEEEKGREGEEEGEGNKYAVEGREKGRKGRGMDWRK